MDVPSKDPFAAIRASMSAKLAGFTPEFPPELSRWDMEATRPCAAEFPVPELLLLALRNVMGFRCSGPGEKVRWSVYASVAGEPVVFELRKLGFTILHRQGSSLDLRRVQGQLKSALRLLEEHLEIIAEGQVDEGFVTIVNRFSEFEARYRFFRDLAEQAHDRAEGPPPVLEDGEAKKIDLEGLGQMMSAEINHRIRAKREGFFHSTAMIDAYFSSLEHRLILLRAFTGKLFTNGEFRELLTAKWDDKIKMVLRVAGNRQAEEGLGNLRRIKERIRNPFAHGGVENDGGSLFFHMPTVGAIPANLSRFKDSVRFNFVPVDVDDHATICDVFDGLDSLLQSGPLSGPHQLMIAGVDPAFDPKSLTEYAIATRGDPESLESYVEAWSRDWERHTNMDY